MANPTRLAVWRTIAVSFPLAWHAFVGLREATLIAIALELLVDLVRATVTPDNLGAGLIRLLLSTLAGVAILSPYAVLVHRRLILNDPDRNYAQALLHPRTIRFAAAAIGLSAVGMPGWLLMMGAALGWSTGAADLATGLGLVWSIAVAVLFLRTLLAFPAIAADDAEAPFAASMRATRGCAWRIFWVCVLASLIWLPASLICDWIAAFDVIGFVGVVGRAVVSAFGFCLLVAIASHLYMTRPAWSQAAPVA